MDQLDKLKDAWKSQDYSKHKVSTKDIYRMLHAKSSSYVKWIFLISVIEFLIIIVLNISVDGGKYMNIYKNMGMYNLVKATSVISYIIMIVFIYLFYKSYIKIKVDTNVKLLMENILKTRKTVKYYIYFNIGFMALSALILFSTIFSSDEKIAIYKQATEIPQNFSNTTLITSVIVFMIIFIGFVLLIYRLVYGILLKRLKKNYKELQLLDK